MKTNLTQTHCFKKYAYIKVTRLTRQPCKKSFKQYQAIMNNAEKRPNYIFKSGRLSLKYFEYVNTLFGNLLR